MIQVTERDLTGQLLGLPLRVVQAMVKEQVRQGNPPNVTIFQDQLNASVYEEGFSWMDTQEGTEFWNSVLNDKKFDLFDRFYSGRDKFAEGLNQYAKEIFENNKAKGFWDKERNIGEMLMLVASELGEAMEAHRRGLNARIDIFNQHYSEKLTTKKFQELFEETIKETLEDEIADAIIRLLDMCGGLGIDIEFHIRNKVAYNKTREKLHGKKY